MNSTFGFLESILYANQIREVRIEHPPLFVLGIWRSGTTHLHNLLSLDQNFVAPTVYQAFYPHHFLTTQRFGSKLADLIAPLTRPMDNMAFNSAVPLEDEIAIAALSTVSPYLRVLFPVSNDLPYSEQDPEGLPPEALDEWKECFILFLRKLTLVDRRRIVLKSPPHMGRIRLLLELFPDAQFVHIVRNPYKVFLSAKHLWQELGTHSCLQMPDTALLEEGIFQWYGELFSLFEKERSLIPDGALHEMKFEDLQAQPFEELKTLYEALKLPGFDAFQKRVEVYLETISGYQKNVYSLDEATREKVGFEWGKVFERYGYPI